MITLSGGPFGGLEIENNNYNIDDIIEHEGCRYKMIEDNFAIFIGMI